MLKPTRKIEALDADLARLDYPIRVVVVAISDISKGSKSVRNACCQVNRSRHEFQIFLCFYDGGVTGVFLNPIYWYTSHSEIC